jgi:hypothetical protein
MDEGGSGKENVSRAYEDHEISYKEFHDYYDLGTNHFSKIGMLCLSTVSCLLIVVICDNMQCSAVPCSAVQ